MIKNPKNFSVKIIRGLPYIYSWSYRKKSYRSNTVSQRYQWKYRGRYGTKRVQNFIKQLNEKEQAQLKQEVKNKLKIYEETQKKIKNLLEREPFKTRYTEIVKIKNRITREQKLKAFYREINQILKN